MRANTNSNNRCVCKESKIKRNERKKEKSIRIIKHNSTITMKYCTNYAVTNSRILFVTKL